MRSRILRGSQVGIERLMTQIEQLSIRDHDITLEAVPGCAVNTVASRRESVLVIKRAVDLTGVLDRARPGIEGQVGMSAYSASKSAVMRLTESMAAELKTYGINVNCIIPGTIDTKQNREAMPEADFSTWVAPESLADVILFLSSDAARDIHGVALPIYGRS